MRKRLRLLLTAGFLALSWAAFDAASSPVLASSDRCSGLTQPLCRSVKTCTSWSVCEAGPASITRCCASEQTDYYYFPSAG